MKEIGNMWIRLTKKGDETNLFKKSLALILSGAITLPFDVYDWQDKAEEILYNLHLYGICKSFYEHCYFENTITWSKGMRYPKYDDVWSVDISETEFTGINDINLKNALKKSKEIYMFS